VSEHEHTHEPLTPEQEQALDLYNAAEELYGLGQYTQCIAVLDQALALLPDESEVWRLRGNALRGLKDYPPALQAFKKANECDPSNWRVVTDLAFTQLERGKLEIALKLYETVLYEMKPCDETARTDLLFSRAFVLQRLGRLEEAYAGYSEAYSQTNQDEDNEFAGQIVVNRGNVAACLGRFADAAADYDHAKVLDPENANSAWMALWAHMSEEGANLQINDNLRAVQLRTIMDLEPERYIAKLCMGLLILGEGHPEMAQTHFDAAGLQEPEEWDPPFWQGLALALQGESVQAKLAIDQALTMDLPPMLIIPLYWTQGNPAFFEGYAAPLLQSFGLYPGEWSIPTN